MEAREFLFRLSLGAGVSLNTKVKLWEAAQTTGDYHDLAKLCELAGVRAASMARLIDHFYSPELTAALQANQAVPHVTLLDPAYPPLLRETATPPLVLYFQGDLRLAYRRSVAVVGSRAMSAYARAALQELLPPVVASGYPVISGLARGVDSLAHDLTRQYGGRPIGVIGTGLDQVYPRNNQSRQAWVAQCGLLLTEYPLNSPPVAHHFPERNRIIAGLGQACLVVMAREKSGSLITANLALQENRNVLAVPGPITSDLCAGCNQLIAAGARPALSASDLLEEVQAPRLTPVNLIENVDDSSKKA